MHNLAAHGALGVLVEHVREGPEQRGEVALGAARPLIQKHVLAGGDAKGQRILAAVALEHRLADGGLAVRARRHGLRGVDEVLLALLAHHVLDTLLVLLRNRGAVLRLHQHRRELVRRCLEVHLDALHHRRRQDGHNVLREALDVARDTKEHASGGRVVAQLDESLHYHVAVEQHEGAPQLAQNPHVVLAEGAEGLEQHAVGVAVVAELLLLAGQDHRRARRLLVRVQRKVQSEDVLEVLGLAVDLAHQVREHAVRQRLVLRLGDNGDALLEARLAAHLEVLGEGAGVLQGKREEVARGLVVVDAFVVVRNVHVLLVVRDGGARGQRTRVLHECLAERAHLVVFLCNVHRLLGFLGHEEELNRRLVLPELDAGTCDKGGGVVGLRAAHDAVSVVDIVKVVDLETHDVVPVLGLRVRTLRVAVGPLGLLSLGVHGEDVLGLDLLHELLRGLEVARLADVDAGGLLGLVGALV
eukprot:PhM_4_TR3598/c0_g1_i1/m.45003